MEGWKIALTAVGSAVAGVLVLWPLGIWYEVEVKCEKPKYEVLRRLGPKKRSLLGGTYQAAELRRYAPMLIAEVSVAGAGNMREASSAGFRAIASFIFGQNRAADAPPDAAQSEAVAMTSPVRIEMGPGEKVAMTSPVRMDMGAGGSAAASGSDAASGPATMSFVMPSKYTLATLPKPNNPNVKIKEVPAHLVAALPFRGHIRGTKLVGEKEAELRAILKEEGLSPVGPLQLYQYYPPFTLGWTRRNEVLFQVKDGAAAGPAKSS